MQMLHAAENKYAWADVLDRQGVPRAEFVSSLEQANDLQSLIARLKRLPQLQPRVESLVKALVADQRRRLLLQVMAGSPGAESCRRRFAEQLVKLGAKPENTHQMVNDTLGRLKSKAGCHDRMLDIVRDCMHMLSSILKSFTSLLVCVRWRRPSWPTCHHVTGRG